MFNNQFSVSDIAHTARCYTELAAEGMGVAIGAGNASVDVSGRLAWKCSIGFNLVEISKHDYVAVDETTSWLGEGGVWGGGVENSQRCIYKRGSGGYVHILCRYKQVITNCNSALVKFQH